MKKRILAALLAVLMMLPMALTAFGANDTNINYIATDWGDKAKRLEAMGEPVAKSPDGNMELYLDMNSGEMGIKNLKTGDIYLTNPHTIGSSSLLNREKPYALSQIDLNFTVISSGVSKTFHSFNDCLSVGQAKFKIMDHGIEVSYAIGAQEQRLLIPNKISVDDMEALLARFPEGTDTIKRNIRGAYNLYCSKKGAAEVYAKYPQLSESFIWLSNPSDGRIQSNLKEYPISATTPIYVIKSVGSNNGRIQTYFFENLTTDPDKTALKAELDEYIDACYAKVEEKGIDDFSTEERPKFELTETYEITNTGLVATVDTSTLKYDTTKYRVNTISILPYFNSANAQRTEKIDDVTIKTCDKGYTFIPDGSGALVRFEDLFENNNKQVKFENDMYGNDYAYYQVKIKNAENMTMPVFGLANQTDKTGFLAVIEDGDALAVITSNHSTAYHSIYSTFKITPSDVYDLADSFSGGSSSSNKISISADRIYKGKCQVNYTMLMDDETAENAGIDNYYENSYVGMANCYRDYLEAKGAISKIPDNLINKDYTKIFFETFGSIEVEEKFLTFPITVNRELTTFADIKEIYKELYAPKDASNKIGNISFILKGFSNGGLSSEYPTYVDWDSAVGGDEGLEDLLADAKKNGYDVITDVEFSYSYGSGWFSGYSNDENGARTLDNRYTTKRTYYAATQTFERTGGVAVSAGSFEYLYDLFYEEMSQYGVNYLSVRSLGSDLNSDFDKEDYYNREAAKDEVVAMLQLLKGKDGNKGYKLLIDAGNSYAIPYADAILSASLDSSRRSEMSESVPFFGIVYHSYIEFAGNAYNTEGDTDYAFLKAIENGACLYFTIAKDNIELLKFDPEYNKYYSVSYDNLKDTIVSTYKEFNGLMADVQSLYIVDHEFVGGTRTEDGGEIDESAIVMVEYGDKVDGKYVGKVGFILNYSVYEAEVTLPNGETAVVAPLGYVKYYK